MKMYVINFNSAHIATLPWILGPVWKPIFIEECNLEVLQTVVNYDVALQSIALTLNMIFDTSWEILL